MFSLPQVSSPLSTGFPPKPALGLPFLGQAPPSDLGAQPMTQAARRGRLPWIAAPAEAATAAAATMQQSAEGSEDSKLAQAIRLCIGPRSFLNTAPSTPVAFDYVYRSDLFI